MADKQYSNENRGAIFSQEPETENHPNYTGKLNVEGKDYYVAAWSKTSKAGNDYISLAISEPKEKSDKKDWIKPELREKFQQDEVLTEEEEQAIADEEILASIPF